MLGKDTLLILLGAGASKDAGIPVSQEMVDKIEEKLKREWKEHESLYYYLRSSIAYHDGIFGEETNFNVERLLVVMQEIEKRDRNILFPFIGIWNLKLMDVGGNNFTKITEFRTLIRSTLTEWVVLNKLEDYKTRASYYSGFTKFHQDYGFNIPVFSLNYDLCFEKVVGKENIQLGFTEGTDEWHRTNFSNPDSKPFTLYKLHGSVDWVKNTITDKLKLSNLEVPKPELIFGVDAKLSSLDPYFFYAGEFRRISLEQDCRIILTIGYSFSDDHINNMISQAIKDNENKKLVVVCPCSENKKIKWEDYVCSALQVDTTKKDNQLIFRYETAKEYLSNSFTKSSLAEYVKVEDVFSSIESST